MAPKELEKKTVKELKAAARRAKIRGYSKMKKADLVEALDKVPKTPHGEERAVAMKPAPGKLAKAPREGRAVAKRRAPGKPAETPREERAVAAGKSAPPTTARTEPPPGTESFDVQGELPGRYLKPRAVLLVQNPKWLFFFWDYDGETEGRLTAGGGQPHLRVLQNDREVRRTPVDHAGRRYYVEVPAGGGRLRVELGRESFGEFVTILASNEVATPAARISERTDLQFTAPEWTGARTEELRHSHVLSEQDYRAFFGDVRTDMPWYREMQK